MSLTLPASIWSPEDLGELITDLQHYGQWLSSYHIKQHVAAASSPTSPPELSAAAVGCLQDLHRKQSLTTAALEQLIAELQIVQTKAPRIVFTLAGAPSSGLKKNLAGWCREHIAPDILVSFQFNSTILGGMVVRYGSHIYDWSFRRSILVNQDRFAEILRNV